MEVPPTVGAYADSPSLMECETQTPIKERWGDIPMDKEVSLVVKGKSEHGVGNRHAIQDYQDLGSQHVRWGFGGKEDKISEGTGSGGTPWRSSN